MAYSLLIQQRLAKERAEREGRDRSWEVVADVLSHLDKNDVVLETNPLYLGDNQPSSYLEQVQILFPEVGPGYGAVFQRAVFLLIDLLPHVVRDRMTDEERVAIGWADIPKEPT